MRGGTILFLAIKLKFALLLMSPTFWPCYSAGYFEGPFQEEPGTFSCISWAGMLWFYNIRLLIIVVVSFPSILTTKMMTASFCLVLHPMTRLMKGMIQKPSLHIKISCLSLILITQHSGSLSFSITENASHWLWHQ